MDYRSTRDRRGITYYLAEYSTADLLGLLGNPGPAVRDLVDVTLHAGSWRGRLVDGDAGDSAARHWLLERQRFGFARCCPVELGFLPGSQVEVGCNRRPSAVDKDDDAMQLRFVPMAARKLQPE
jgi:hypothetical protein